ncbi:hypothetical protein V4890_18280 [Ralstonia solanacearum species complex bacterium KE056]|uniref:hypothetical protein n=1 Tax=Ralstonia solanacearum species complex bacterium KE056 TaxID=3119585 RepID=UPI002FC30AF4
MIRWFASLCLWLSALLLTGCEPSGTFAYRDYLNNLKLVINMEEGTLSDGHLLWPLQNCDDNYYCIKSAVFEFSVPKKMDESPSWRLGDATYTLSGKRNVKWLGEQTTALLIKRQQGDQKIWFLYSKEKGLIGFGAYEATGGMTYFWLEGKCGFGGEQRC